MVAEWRKPRPADLVVLSLIPAGDGNLFKRKQGPIAYILSL